MGIKDTAELIKFLEPFDTKVVDTALWLRKFVWKRYPESNELIYDNYNAVAFGWSTTLKVTDIFCSVAVYSNDIVHFGFYWGARLTDPKKMLLGAGKQYRFIRVTTKKDFPADDVEDLLAEAHINSLAAAKNIEAAPKGETIVRSISAKKKRPLKT